MSENNELNIVNLVRERTGDEDLEEYLKSTLGGYTKKSVREYLAELRKKQQESAEIFHQNMQLVLEEKERVKADNEKLKLKITQIESDYKWLSDTFKINELDNSDVSVDDILEIKSRLTALELENKELQKNARDLNKTVESLNNEIYGKDQQIKKAVQESKILRENLSAEKQETKKQVERVSELSVTVGDLQEEIQCLKALIEEKSINKLNGTISELIANISMQDEIIDRKTQEISEKEKLIESVTAENGAANQSIIALTKSLEDLSSQNEKLMYTNSELSRLLEADHARIISLIKEKSEQAVEKLKINRKLDEMNLSATLAELGGEKQREKASGNTAR